MSRARAIGRGILGYGLAIALVALVLAFPSIRASIAGPIPFILLFIAALVAARHAGRGPGLLAALLAAGAILGWPAPPLPWVLEADRLRGLHAVAFLLTAGVGAWCVASLRDAHDRMEEMLDRVPDGFLVLDRKGRLVYANLKAAELAGVTREQLVGRPFSTGFPALAGAGEGEWRNAMRARAPIEIEAVMPESGRRLRAHLFPTPRGMTAALRDITAEHASRRNLAGSFTELARTNQELELVARLSHQLAQPLGSIANYAELIRMQSTGATAHYARQVVTLVSQLALLMRRPARGEWPKDVREAPRVPGPGEGEPPA